MFFKVPSKLNLASGLLGGHEKAMNVLYSQHITFCCSGIRQEEEEGRPSSLNLTPLPNSFYATTPPPLHPPPFPPAELS